MISMEHDGYARGNKKIDEESLKSESSIAKLGVKRNVKVFRLPSVGVCVGLILFISEHDAPLQLIL